MPAIRKLVILANTLRNKLGMSDFDFDESDRAASLPPRARGPRPTPPSVLPQQDIESIDQYNWESTKQPSQLEGPDTLPAPELDERITRKFYRHTLPSPESIKLEPADSHKSMAAQHFLNTFGEALIDVIGYYSSDLKKFKVSKDSDPTGIEMRNRIEGIKQIEEIDYQLREYLKPTSE